MEIQWHEIISYGLFLTQSNPDLQHLNRVCVCVYILINFLSTVVLYSVLFTVRSLLDSVVMGAFLLAGSRGITR